MELSELLSAADVGNIHVMKMGADKLPNFLSLFSDHFRDCFASDEKISQSVQRAAGSMTRSEIIRSFFAENPSVRSGDFGEVLTYSLLEEELAGQGLGGPKKWRWKESPDKAAGGSDVILFFVGDAPSTDDVLLSAEVKASATGSTRDQFVNAIEGAKKDDVSRLAASLIWYRKKAIQDGDSDLKDKLNRFIESVDKTAYQKITMAVLVTDAQFEQGYLNSVSGLSVGNIQLRLISLEDMQGVYESAYLNAENT